MGKVKIPLQAKKVKISNTQEHIFSLNSLITKETEEEITNYTFKDFLIELKIKIPNSHLSLKEVSDARNDNIDSTGFLIWPSEELISLLILTFFSKNSKKITEEIFPLKKNFLKVKMRKMKKSKFWKLGQVIVD